MHPFAPPADPHLKSLIDTLLVPLFLLSACASIVWGLQDRYSHAVWWLRSLTTEYRSDHMIPAALDKIRFLTRRLRLIRTAVTGFYLVILTQVLAASWIALLLLRLPLPVWPVLLLFEMGLVILFIAVAIALADTWLVYRTVLEEVGDTGALG